MALVVFQSCRLRIEGLRSGNSGELEQQNIRPGLRQQLLLDIASLCSLDLEIYRGGQNIPFKAGTPLN
jgi:hypothetical protein